MPTLESQRFPVLIEVSFFGRTLPAYQLKIPLLPNNVGKKSVNDSGPKHGHNMYRCVWYTYYDVSLRNYQWCT